MTLSKCDKRDWGQIGDDIMTVSHEFFRVQISERRTELRGNHQMSPEVLIQVCEFIPNVPGRR